MCSKLNGTVLEYFIKNSRTDRYNLRCSITARDRKKPTCTDDANSSVCRSINNNATTAALKSLVETLNFILCWIKHFQRNYQGILIIYHEDIIELCKKCQL